MGEVREFRMKRRKTDTQRPLAVADLDDFVIAGRAIVDARRYINEMTESQRRTVLAASMMNGSWPKDSITDITETLLRMTQDVKASLPWWKRIYRG